MKNLMKGISFLAIATALSACGQQGKEYIGSWQAKEYTNRTTVIERNGDNFVIKATEPSSFRRGKLDTIVWPAIYKDGVLEFSNGWSTVQAGYLKDTDTLLMPTMGGSMEYRRVK